METKSARGGALPLANRRGKRRVRVLYLRGKDDETAARELGDSGRSRRIAVDFEGRLEGDVEVIYVALANARR